MLGDILFQSIRITQSNKNSESTYSNLCNMPCHVILRDLYLEGKNEMLFIRLPCQMVRLWPD